MKKSIFAIYLICLMQISVFSQGAFNNQVRFMATGDLNLAHWITPIIEKEGKDYPFKYIKENLFAADIVFANLEAPFCNEGIPFEKNFVFKVPDTHINVLKAGNINLVSLANNHILDYGISCLENTVSLLKNMVHNSIFK